MRNFTQNTQSHRPRTSEPTRALVINPVLPGETGTATLVFINGVNGELERLPEPEGEQPDRSFDVKDVNDNNCLLPEELIWVRFEDEVNEFVPIGSQGLVRRAFANESLEADQSGEFTIAKDGEVVTYTNEDDEQVDVVVTATTEVAVEKDDLCWVVYLIGEESSGGEVFRAGRWVVLSAEGDCGCETEDDCCDCDKRTLYLELNNANITWESVGKPKIRNGMVTHTIKLTCSDNATRIIELSALDCDTQDCKTLDLTGEYVGTCEIGIVEYGNGLECAPDGGGPEDDPTRTECGNPEPHVFVDDFLTEPDGDHKELPVASTFAQNQPGGASHYITGTAPTPKHQDSRLIVRCRFMVESSLGDVGARVTIRVPGGNAQLANGFTIWAFNILDAVSPFFGTWYSKSFFYEGSGGLASGTMLKAFDNSYHEFTVEMIGGQYVAKFDGIELPDRIAAPTGNVCPVAGGSIEAINSYIYRSSTHNYTTDPADLMIDVVELSWL